MKRILPLAALLLTCMSATPAMAYDFAADGIFYNITSEANKTVAVTYETNSFNSYSGAVSIPSQVTNDGVTYQVTSLGEYAFKTCSGLTSVEIPNTVTTIKKYVFRECTAMKSIVLPNSIDTIGESAFYGCNGLESIDMGNAVTNIEKFAFYKCSSLTAIEIPSTVDTIGGSAFYGCSALKSFTNHRVVPQNIRKTVFSGVDGTTCVLYVPQGAMANYKAATIWQDFVNVVEIMPTAINEVTEASGLNVRAHNGAITIEGNGNPATVFTIDGRIAYQGCDSHIPLAAGVYVVKAGNAVQKVAVK